MFNSILNEKMLNAGKEYASEIVDSLKTMLGIDDDALAKDVYEKSIHSDSLSGLLPYLGWDDAAQLFILDSGEQTKKTEAKHFLGFCYELMPQTGADDSMENVLQSIYLQAPPGTSISIHNYASPNIMPSLKRMAQLRYSDLTLGIKKEEWEKRNNNVFQRMARKRIDFYLNATSKPLFNDFASIVFKDHRVVFSVVVPASPSKSGDIDTVMLLKEQLKSTLSSANFPCWEWKPVDLINFVSDFFDHSRMMHTPSRIERAYEPYEKIRKQIVGREVESEVTADQINFQNSMSNVDTTVVQLSVTQFPRFFHLTMMSSMIGDYFQSALAYPCPYMITTSAIVQDYDNMRQKTSLKTATSTRKTEGYFAKIDPIIAEEAYEWKTALKAVDDGGTLIQVSTSVTLITRKKDAGKARGEVMAIWRAKGFRLASDKYQQLVGFLSVMPMALTPTMVGDLKKMSRFSTKYSQNAVSLSPLMGEWKGSGTPVMNFFGRRGQLVNIDLFDNAAGNYNFAIVGASGSGKSFLTQELLISYRANQARVWVIDVGRSYENICRMLDGDFIEFTESANLCINPFTFIQNLDEELDMLKPLISRMMSPDKPLPSWERSMLELGIQKVFSKLKNKMTITDLARYFLEGCSEELPEGEEKKECDPRLRDMGVMLYPWTKEGAYGKYFDGDSNITFTNNFTVLELEELKSKKELQSIVMMIMMYRISQETYLSRDLRKIVMIDEAWAILHGDSDTADFIETGYRRARKYGAAFGTATQNYGDYLKSPGAMAALQNADWTFTLRQKEDSIEALEKSGLMNLANDPFKKRSLRDLKKIDGRYSEVFIQYPEGSGTVRFLTDPYSQMLYSSKAEHFKKIQEYKSQGYEIGESVQMAMHHFGIVEPEPLSYE